MGRREEAGPSLAARPYQEEEEEDLMRVCVCMWVVQVSSAKQQELEEALHVLTREDPSLRVETDEESGQVTVGGVTADVVTGRRKGYRAPGVGRAVGQAASWCLDRVWITVVASSCCCCHVITSWYVW